MKRSTVLALFVSLLFLSSTLLRATEAPKASMFRGDLAHTGRYTGKMPSFRGLRWKFKTNAMVRSSAAVADGMVFFGSDDAHLYAVDLATGNLRWKFKTGGRVACTPAVAHDNVYFQSDDHTFYALDARSGKRLWQFHTGQDLPHANQALPPWIDDWDYFLSSPALAGNTVFFGSGDGYVYALNASNGRQVWKFKTQGRVRSSPAVSDGVVFAGSYDGHLYAIDARTGEAKWRYKTEGNSYFPQGEIQSSPAVAGGTVYFGSRDYYLYALEEGTGKLKWRALHKDSWIVTSPAVADGVVYAGSSDGRFVQAIDAGTGQEKWRYKTDLNVFSSPALMGNTTLLFGGHDGRLTILDAQTGTLKGGLPVEGQINSSPVIVEGVVLFGSDGGSMYALE